MTLQQALTIAGVPAELHAEAEASITAAKDRKRGLLLAKLYVRWLKAGKIADALSWEDDRLIDVAPDLLDWDIAPVFNVTAHGDNGPWHDTVRGGRPDEHYWANADPVSAEYKTAVASNYWLPGTHPRSKESRKAWYRRNAGEAKAYRLGAAIDPAQGFEIWRGQDGKDTAIVWHCCGAWIVQHSKHIIGPLYLNTRKGFEIDNVFCGDLAPQMWWPIPGYELRAPVTWSVTPGGPLDLTPKGWETTQSNGEGKTYTNYRFSK